jgi:aminopeptidase
VDARFEALGDLAVHGANVQRGQIVGVAATIGHEDLARTVAAAAYRRGALFVDVWYFDPFVKRARIEHADPDTLDFVPPWYGARVLQLGERDSARIGIGGVVWPHAFDGLDPGILGRDHLPWLKETTKVIDERSTNWCGVVCPHPQWAELVYPELPPGEAYERLWQELWHVYRLDEADPKAAWDARMAQLKASAGAMNEGGFDAIELSGPGTELTIGLLPTSRWLAADFETRNGLQHFPNLPTEEVFTTPDPERVDGHVSATRPLVLGDGTIVRELRVRFEHGRAVEIDAAENAGALRARAGSDEGAGRLGELALVDREGRIGPLGTVFYNTLLDENAASHIALGGGFSFAVGEDDQSRINRSGIHIDFMVGSNNLEVTGIRADGTRVPVLREGAWQL